MTLTQLSEKLAPEETAPHMKAHMGANQVTGFNNSRTLAGAGNWRDEGVGCRTCSDMKCTLKLTLMGVNKN